MFEIFFCANCGATFSVAKELVDEWSLKNPRDEFGAKFGPLATLEMNMELCCESMYIQWMSGKFPDFFVEIDQPDTMDNALPTVRHFIELECIEEKRIGRMDFIIKGVE